MPDLANYRNEIRVAGIDLAGKSENPTGLCFISSAGVRTKRVFTDAEILREITNFKPRVVAIDAPLWLPPANVAWRLCEVLLMKRGFRPLSLLFPSMRLLAMRAKRIANEIRKMNIEVIEVFAAASEKILGLKKQRGRNKDEYDALLCALTAKAYMEGNYEDLGGIIIPK